MSEHTGIEWCDHTFNIAWGCQKVSPGCAHCYAETLSRRYRHDVWGPASTTARRTFGKTYWNQPIRWNRRALRDGVRRRVFCSSMCDVFEDHPTIDAERTKLWPLIRATPQLDWLLLTKRPWRIAANLPDDWGPFGYPNVWLGTSVESQEYVERIVHLGRVPAAIRFLSAEPLLGPLDLSTYITTFRGPVMPLDKLDWVIAGGESGPGARPCEESWIRSLYDQCEAGLIPFFMKQLGGHPDKRGGDAALLEGSRHAAFPTLRSRPR